MNRITSLPRRRAMAAVLALAATLLGVAKAPGHAQSAAGDVLDVRPLPGSVVAVDGVTVTGLVTTDETPDRVVVEVDGVEVASSTRTAGSGVRVSARIDDLAAGDRTLAVRATTPDGAITRRWSVTAAKQSLQRLGGPDRFATAVASSQDQFPEDGAAPAAVLARADDFADALAGAPLAAQLGGSLLLTDSATVPPATAQELDRVLGRGATIHVLGGPAAVSEDVVRDLEADGHRVVRHAGATRYDTAVAIAEQFPSVDRVLVVSGRRFPDALAASAWAGREGRPILLTEQDRLPGATRAGIERIAPIEATIVGGTVAVSDGVARQIERVLPRPVKRVAGETRYDTAATIARRFFGSTDTVALASGVTFPDALGAAVRAAGLGAPLLLTDPTTLPTEARRALRHLPVDHLGVHGGPAAIREDVVDAAFHATVDSANAPIVQSTTPASGATSSTLAPIRVHLNRPVPASGVVAAVTLDGTELPTSVRLADDGSTVVVDPLSPGDLPLADPRPVRVVVRATGDDGRTVHHIHTFTLQDDARFATASGIALAVPSEAVEVIGYHQSNHEGARQMEPTSNSPEWLTMANRGRRTASRTSADIVADEGVPVTAPVTGRVVRSGSYVLYCDFTDNFLAIEPDGMPGHEVKMLHFRGLRVGPGDRVVGGRTVVGDGPRQLPFSSQVDKYSDSGHGPHVHVEVIDTSIPNVSNGGSGSEDC